MTLQLTYIHGTADATRRTTEGGSRCMMKKGESAPPPARPLSAAKGAAANNLSEARRSPTAGLLRASLRVCMAWRRKNV